MDKPKIVRVVRTIEYVGPEPWINAVLAMSWLTSGSTEKFLLPGHTIKLLKEDRSDVSSTT